MALVISKKVNGHTRIGIWEISEPQQELICKLGITELPESIKSTNGKKQIQRLSVLCIANSFFQDGIESFDYTETGKPFIKKFPGYISISHTNAYAAFIASEKYPVGIDIELISPRIERIFPKFMSESEINSVSMDNRLEQLYVYWCAKEAMYKYYGLKELEFIKNLPIEPFTYTESGIITGHIITESFVKTLQLNYEKTADHMLVYTVE